MSDEPISAAEGIDVAALERAGWHNAELVWEQIQETAAASVLAGDLADASELWLGALEVAETQFAAEDPRLGTSLANAARAHRIAGDDALADTLYERAAVAWGACDEWVAALAPERRARSSLFHLRLESKHRGRYARHSLARYRALVEETRTHLAAIVAGATPDTERLARWQRQKPAGLEDARRLLAAALLLA